jgi:prolipoprotein diacylglyceryltransferase
MFATWYHWRVVAFYLPGGVPIYALSLLLGLGISLGLAWVAWSANASGRDALRPVNAGLWTLFGALVGGRAGFVVANWPYFQAQPAESLQVSLGGLSWPGALAGALAALGLYAGITAQSLGVLADDLLPLAATLTVSAWLGCWLDGCAYGPLANVWWGLPARDEWGRLALRWPTQLLGALLALGWFWLLELRIVYGRGIRADASSHPPSRTTKAGRMATWGLLGFSVQMAALSFLRADPAPHWQALRLDTWAALAFTGLAGLALIVMAKIDHRE